ncbi:MAG TPA: hypothetical protein VIY53_12825 [Acidobacteriaceae bacterium]
MTETIAITLEPPREAHVAAAGERASACVASYRAYGVSITLRTTAQLMAALPSPLIPGAESSALETNPAVVFRFYPAPSSAGRPVFVVGEGDRAIFASADLREATRVLESQMHLRAAALTEQYVFVHAGVVQWGGRALLLPGASHTGKSSLVAALVAAGAQYYSDEYAVIDLQGRVRAFPRQMRLRENGADKSDGSDAAEPVRASALGPLPVGWVMSLRFRDGAIWSPKELTPGQTVLALLENTIAVRRQSELTLSTLKLAVETARAWQSERGDAAHAALEVLRIIGENSKIHGVQPDVSQGRTR